MKRFWWLAVLAGASCSPTLNRPDVPPSRMIAPSTPMLEPRDDAPEAIAVRLVDTQARGHIGRRMLHQGNDGEILEDAVWSWSVLPDRYLDSALHVVAASDPAVSVVDTSAAPSLAVTLVALHIDGDRLVSRAEVRITHRDRTVRTATIAAEESLSPERPGNLADASGRLFQRLATESLARVK